MSHMRSDGSNVWVWESGFVSRREQLTLDARNIHGRYCITGWPISGVLFRPHRHVSTSGALRSSSSELVRLTSGEGDVSPRFSPDGQWIVSKVGSRPVRRFGAYRSTAVKQFDLPAARAQKPDVSPDGKLISYHTLDSESAAVTMDLRRHALRRWTNDQEVYFRTDRGRANSAVGTGRVGT